MFLIERICYKMYTTLCIYR